MSQLSELMNEEPSANTQVKIKVFISLRGGQTETVLTGVDQSNADKSRAK